MVEWPHERRHRLNNSAHDPQRLENIDPRLLRKIKAASEDLFIDLASAYLHNYPKPDADPRARLADLSARIDQSGALDGYEQVVRQVALAFTCVEAFREFPERRMWDYLWSLATHSAPLENFLPQAVVYAATDDDDFRNKFFGVARRVVDDAIRNPVRRAIQRDAGVGRNRRAQWLRKPELSELWQGIFDHSDYTVGMEDHAVLLIVAEIDPTEFVRLLALYDHPDPVAHALMWCGASWRFERWRALVSVAPAAFEEQAKWNGSLVLPLLLRIARDQFEFGLGREPTQSQVSEATNDIKNLAAEIARTIAHRADAVGCITRWGNWLVRTAIPAVSANAIPHPTDAASLGFVEDALLEAFVAELPTDHWNAVPPPDAETWEPWCQLAAGTLVTLAGKASMPSMGDFLDEWRLSPEDWPAQKGQILKLHARPFDGAELRADNYGARILAIPMVEAERPDELWKQFWGSTVTLREVVEFGDPGETDNDGWQGRGDAARLLMLQFSIGLMMMDHLIRPQRPLNCDLRAVLEKLLPLLDEAVREMTAIDQLNIKYWSEALRHLAVRRAKWLSEPAEPNAVALGPEAKPTLADFVGLLAGDTESLLGLAYVACQNGIGRAALKAAFKAGGVDISDEIAFAQHLVDISPRAIGIGETQLSAVRAITED